MLVEITSAAFGYDGRPIVRAQRLQLHRGRCVGIFGPNGVGKTTLVRGIAGLLPPLEGNVARHDASLRFGYLTQHRAMELHWPMSGLDVASLAISVRRRFGWVGRARGRVIEQMRVLGVDHLARASFAKLSGGQQQRILLAGALAAEPDVLILDEPTEGLDVQSRRMLLDRLRDSMAQGLCVVLVSHEARDLLALDADLLVLEPSEAEDGASLAIPVDAAHFAEHVMGPMPAGGA